MFKCFLIVIAALPWLIPAVGFLTTLNRRNYPVWIGDLALVLTGFIGLAGIAGQTALRSWMVSWTILAPIILWLLAASVLPRRAGDGAARARSIRRHVLMALLWGVWLAWNGVVLKAATGARGSQEKARLGQLGTVRSALQIFRSDRGTYPADLTELVPRYLLQVPELNVIAAEDRILHRRTWTITNVAGFEPNDAGGLGYVHAPLKTDGTVNPDFGKVFINCTHKDLRGVQRLADY